MYTYIYVCMCVRVYIHACKQISHQICLCRSDAAATGGELVTQHQDTIQRGSCQLSPTPHAPTAYFSSSFNNRSFEDAAQGVTFS